MVTSAGANIDDDVNHSSAGPVYIQDSNFAITLAADILAPLLIVQGH